MIKFKFSVEELQELETLEINGGTGSESTPQSGCTNNAPGCGYGVVQPGCTNNAARCGSETGSDEGIEPVLYFCQLEPIKP